MMLVVMVITRKAMFLNQGPEPVLHGAGTRAAAGAGVVAQRRVQAAAPRKRLERYVMELTSADLRGRRGLGCGTKARSIRAIAGDGLAQDEAGFTPLEESAYRSACCVHLWAADADRRAQL